ncbi:heme exporter protein CcmB [Denitrobaculum tricleocarpae]|uniref:Heme exporter protein B n=1 Tax=Denitrobaculum tricleocarpae TaxID=2591009 RepID=A0A545TR05_9PROT|nr:heme exporter protein CcmB [Denitrobaculum tricleocarpae]TQV79657.1 heme exporter protein CcmB [Denitrobaculum tricleocarpae]
MTGAGGIIARDLKLALRQRSDAVMIVLFFVLTAALFPFGVGPEANQLAAIAPGVIWVTALLAVLLSLERLFLADYEDGSLELMALSPVPLEFTVLAKVFAHWLTTGLPLIASAPLIAVLFNMPASALPTLAFAMLLGTPTLSLIGAIGAALTLGARRGGVLVPLLVLPLYIPTLIFGVSAVDAALLGFPVRPHLLLLAGILLISLVVSPLAGAAALRQANE